METPNLKTKIFYSAKPAVYFKAKMEKYKENYKLPDSCKPLLIISKNPKKGVIRNREFIYTIKYYEFSKRQLRPKLETQRMVVQATTKGKAQERFYEITKDTSETAFIRAIKGDKVDGTDKYDFVVEWRKAIYRKHKSKKRT